MGFQYPKPYMSITELIETTGLSRDYLKRIARIDKAPIIKTNGGGKVYFRTSELEEFFIEVSKIEERCRDKRRN